MPLPAWFLWSSHNVFPDSASVYCFAYFLNVVNDTFKNLAASVRSKVDAEKSDISNYKSKITNQKTQFNEKLDKLNAVNDEENASNTLKADRKTSMIGDYLTLAYYACTNMIILYLLHKEYKFSIFYFFGVFLVILAIIFILALFGIPYNW